MTEKNELFSFKSSDHSFFLLQTVPVHGLKADRFFTSMMQPNTKFDTLKGSSITERRKVISSSLLSQSAVLLLE